MPKINLHLRRWGSGFMCFKASQVIQAAAKIESTLLAHYVQNSQVQCLARHLLSADNNTPLKEAKCTDRHLEAIPQNQCDNTDGPCGHYAKWDKADRKRQILKDLTSMWNLNNQSLQKQDVFAWGVANGRCWSKGRNFQLQDKMNAGHGMYSKMIRS